MSNIFPIDFEEKLTMAQDDYILFSDSEDGNKIKKAQYKNLKGEPGTPGTPGKDGEDGHTPVKGVDYFTQEDIASLNIPSKTSQLNNDSGFITNTVNNLANYYKKSETYTQAEINTLISNFGGFEVVSTLPSTDIKTNVIYLKGPIGSGADKYEEYIYSSERILIGETSVDLTNYFNTSTDDSDDIPEGTTNLFLTAAERAILRNTSGTNTGDQTANDFDIKDLKDTTGLKTAWNGKIAVSSDTGNLISVGGKLWLGTETDFSSISTPDTNTLYIQYKSDGGGGWQPGVNTLLYCPFNGDGDNYANNGYTTTAANTPITYTSIGSRQVGYFNHGGVYINVSDAAELNGSLTYNIRIKTGQNATLGQTIVEAGIESNRKARYLQNQGDINYRAAFWYSDLDTPNNSLIYDTWQNVVMTLDGNTHARCMYINGVLSASDTANTNSFTATQLGVGVIASLGSSGGVDDTYLSEVIVENKCWTAQEVSDYFNATKSTYGIS